MIKMNRKVVTVATIIIIATIATWAYASTLSAPRSTIKVSGAFSLYPMMVKWAEEYQKIHRR